MTGKGSGRLHARQQCSDDEMQSNWDRAFGKLDRKLKARQILGESVVYDALKGDGDTFEEKVSLSDEMRLHGEKHKPGAK